MSAFIKLPKQALTDDRLSHRDLRVLMALYSFGANPGDVVWPSRESLSNLTRIKPVHVSVSISRLETFGWVARKQGSRGPNSYTLLCPTVTETVTAEKATVTDLGIHSYQNGNATVTDSVTHITDQEQTKEQTIAVQRAREEDKQPSGASGGGEGPHNGDSAKPKTARAASMTNDWMPSEDCWRLVDKAGIPRDFAHSEIGEFRMYWLDEGTRRKSWNATFLNRVKDQWARQRPKTRASDHATHQRPDNSAPAKVARAIAERDAARQPAGPGVPPDDFIELGSGDYWAVAY
jgi:hypothetical protein